MSLQKFHGELINEIKAIVNSAKKEIYNHINNELLATYWKIGERIALKESKNKIENQSNRSLIIDISRELTLEFGKGYNRSNLTYMKLFYEKFKIGVTVSHQLNWSQYIELLKIDNNLERSFYEKQAIIDKWSVRELRRQRNSALFQRLALSRNKDGIIKLVKSY